jgi:hypothetical protein
MSRKFGCISKSTSAANVQIAVRADLCGVERTHTHTAKSNVRCRYYQHGFFSLKPSKLCGGRGRGDTIQELLQMTPEEEI